MPHREWDVEDERKLRSALGSTNRFANDGYHSMSACPRVGNTDGADGSFGELSTYILAAGATEKCWFNFVIPEHWKRGPIEPIFYVIANTNTGALTANFSIRTRAWSFSGGATPLIIDMTEDFDFDDGSASNVLNKYIPTDWGDAVANLDGMDLLSVRLQRNGAAGTDTIIADVDVAGVKITFNPDARP